MLGGAARQPNWRRACALALALGLSSCATVGDNDQAGDLPRATPAALPAEAPRVIAPPNAEDRESARVLASYGGAYRNAALERYLDDLVQRLAAQSDRPDIPYKLTVLNASSINAFALPSGRLYVTRGLSPGLARRVAVELTAHDALTAHAEAEYGITEASRAAPLRDALAVSASFAAGALVPLVAVVLIPGPVRATVTFVVVLAALALTGWVSARTSHVRPLVPMMRTVVIGAVSMLITYFAGLVLYP